jgi:hypothetical protein
MREKAMLALAQSRWGLCPITAHLQPLQGTETGDLMSAQHVPHDVRNQGPFIQFNFFTDDINQVIEGRLDGCWSCIPCRSC